jgi:hypothetical protein
LAKCPRRDALALKTTVTDLSAHSGTVFIFSTKSDHSSCRRASRSLPVFDPDATAQQLVYKGAVIVEIATAKGKRVRERCAKPYALEHRGGSPE